MTQLDIFGGEDQFTSRSSRISSDIWPKQISEMTDFVADEVAKAGVASGHDLRALAHQIVARITLEYGGGHWYIPKHDSILRILRDQEIWSKYRPGAYRGEGSPEWLARRYGLAELTVRAIIRAQRELHIRSIQADLFDMMDEYRVISNS